MTTYINDIRLFLVCSALACQSLGSAEFKRPPNRTPSEIRHSLGELKAQSSLNAKAALLETALDSDVPEDLRVLAASIFQGKMTNRTEAAVLLESSNTRIQEAGLAAMIGCKLDAQLWQRLTSVLASGTAIQMGLVADIANYDDAFSGEKKALDLIKGFERLEDAIGAGELRGVKWNMKIPAAELACTQLLNALIGIKDLEYVHLAGLTPSTSGMLRDCILVARGFRGDTNVRQELRRIVQKTTQPLIRSKAITAIRQSGTKDDIPALERVAQEDSIVIKNYIPHLASPEEGLNTRTFYPLREQAAEAIKHIMKGSNPAPK